MNYSEKKQKSYLNTKHLYNCFVADFETIIDTTEYYKKTGETGIVYGVIKKMDDSFISSFITIDDMFKDLMDGYPNYSSFKIYFHNLSFDGVFILDWLGRNGFTYDEFAKADKSFTIFRTTGSKIYNIKVKWKEKQFEFRCSKMLLSASVKALGKCVNIDKYASEAQETEDFYRVEPENSVEEFEEKNKDYCLYCERDVEIVRLSLLDFYLSLLEFLDAFNAHDKWGKKVMDGCTISQISLQLQLMCAEKHGLTESDMSFTNIEDREIMDKFTNGGLTIANEAYRHTLITDISGNVIDLKSAYPAVMNGKLPYGPVLKKKPKEEHCAFHIIHYGKIKPKNHQIPLLKNWEQKKVGEANYFLEAENYTTYLYEEEMQLIEQLFEYEDKTIIDSFYFPLKSYLTEFIQYGFKMKELHKKNGNLAASHTFKILLNSAYGIHAKRSDFKLVKGWKGEEWQDKKKSYKLSNIDLNDESRHSYIPNNKLFAYDFTEFINLSLFYSTHKGIANYITAKTRCRILQGIITFKPENFLYCDTDSLFIMNVSKEEILKHCGSELGDWELEDGKDFDSAIVMRSKTYQLYKDGEQVKSGTAGIKKDAIDLREVVDKDSVVIKEASLVPQRVPGGLILLPLDKMLSFDKKTLLKFCGKRLDKFISTIERLRKEENDKTKTDS